MLDSRWASIDAFAENNRDNILRDITRLVAVPVSYTHLFKRFALFVKQAVIRRQAGQEHQHRPPRLEIIHPVVDHAV